MANERWVELRDGQLFLVEELDGADYLLAKGCGEPVRWELVITLGELATTYGGTPSRLFQEATRLLAQAELA